MLTAILFFAMSKMIAKDQVFEESHICNLPFPEPGLHINQCACWFLDKSVVTKETEIGFGCNVLQFEELINGDLPYCK